MPRESLRIEWRQLWIIVFPILAFIAGDQALYWLSNPNLKLTFAESATLVQTESAKRYLLIGAFLLFASVSLFVYFTFWSSFISYMDKESRYKVYAAGIILGSPLLLVLLINLTGSDGGVRFYFFTDPQAFNEALSKSIRLPNRLNMDAKNFLTFLRLTFDLLVMFSATFFVLGCVVTLCEKNDRSKEIDELELLCMQSKNLNFYLYYGVVFMIAVLAFISFWLQWQSTLLGETFTRGADGKPQPLPYESVEKGLSMVFGLQFTLIIFSSYIPTAVLLGGRISSFVRLQQKDGKLLTLKERQDFKTDHGLTTYESAPYKILAAILAPLLAGVLGNTISTALSAFAK